MDLLDSLADAPQAPSAPDIPAGDILDALDAAFESEGVAVGELRPSRLEARREGMGVGEKAAATAYNMTRSFNAALAEAAAAIPETAGQIGEMTGLGGKTLRGFAQSIRDIPGEYDPAFMQGGQKLVEPGFESDVAGAFGSGLSFAAMGGLTKLAGVSARVGAGLFGGVLQAQSMYRDAEAAGADDATKMAAFAMGTGIGASEAFGVGSILDRIDKRSGGQVKSALMRFVTAGAREIPEEAIQEFGQTFAEDVVAKKILEYAEPEEWDAIMANAAKGGLIGGIVGFGMGGLGQAGSELPSTREIGGRIVSKLTGGQAKAEQAAQASQEAAGRDVLAKAAEYQSSEKRTQATPEEAVKRYAEKTGADVGGFEVIEPGMSPVSPEAEALKTKHPDLVGLLQIIEGKKRTVPPVVVVEKGDPARPATYVDGVVVVDGSQTRELAADLALHELTHGRVRSGTPEFKKLVGLASEQFPALTLRMSELYAQDIKRGTGKDPFQAIQNPEARQALMAEEAFAWGAQHSRELIEQLLTDEATITPQLFEESKTWLARVWEWLRNLVGTGPAKQRKAAQALLDEYTSERIRAISKPAELAKFANAIADVFRNVDTEVLDAAAKSPEFTFSALPVVEAVADESAQEVTAEDKAMAEAVDVEALQAEVDKEADQTPVKERKPAKKLAPAPAKPVRPDIDEKLTPAQRKRLKQKQNRERKRQGKTEPPGPPRTYRRDAGPTAAEDAIRRFEEGDERFAAAYHAGPHDFDEFSTEFIGTGAGAQAFGHGLYFASEKEIAEVFKSEVGKGAAGYGYTVNLAPQEDEYLLWDKPIAEQSPKVLKALASLKDAAVTRMVNNGGGAWSVVSQSGKVLATFPTQQRAADYYFARGLEDAYVEDRSIKGSDVMMRVGLDREGSDRLLSVGIRGVKYLADDGPSSDGDPFNYVVFDAADVEIVDRWAAAPAEEGESDTEALSIQFDRMSRWNHLRRAFQDSFVAPRLLQEQIEKERGAELPDDMNMSRAQRLYYGRTDEAINGFRKAEFKRLASILGEAITIDEAHKFAWARHAGERNSWIYKNNDEWHPETNPGSGMRSSVATKLVQDALNGPNAARYKRLDRFLKRMRDKHLDTLREAGELPSDLDAAIEAQGYMHYVPLRHEIKRTDRRRSGAPGGFQATGPNIKKAKGRRSEPDNVILNAMQSVEDAIFKAEKKRVVQALRNLIAAYPDDTFWSVVDVPVKFENDENGVVRAHWTAREDLSEDTIRFYEDGKAKAIIFNDKAKALARAFKGGRVEDAGAIMRGLRAWTRYQSMVNTSLNPEFMLTNMVRDLLTAGLVTTEAEGLKVARAIMKGAIPAVAGIRVNQEDGARILSKFVSEESAAEWGEWWERMRKAGGKTGFFHAKSVEELRADFDKELLRAVGEKGALRKGGAYARAVLDVIDNWNEAVENGVRLAAFRYAVKEMGWSEDKAAEFAKTLTIDFNTRGEQRWLSGLYMFSNAGIQGTARLMASTVKTKTGRRIAASIMLLGAMQDMLMRMLAPDDDDGKNAYDAIPEWKKDRYLMVYTGIGEHGFASIPLPYGFSFFYSAGRNMSSMVAGETSPAQTAANIAASGMTSFSPVGDMEDVSTASLLRFLAPTAADPIVEMAVNQDYMGRPIYREQPYDRTPLPDSQVGRDYTHGAFKWTADLLNSATGGTKFERGVVDIHPETLRYITGLGLGGVARFAVNAAEGALLAAKGEPLSAAARAPFTRQVFTQEYERKGYSDFWENSQDVLAKSDLVNNYEGTGEPGDAKRAREIRTDYQAIIDLAPALKKLERERTRLQDKIKVSEGEKRDKLEADLYAKIREFNRKYQEAKSQ